MRARERLPNRRSCELFSFDVAGHRYTASFGRFPDGRVAEIFLDTGKPNTAVQTHASDSAVLVSLLLQHGVCLETIRHSISGPIRKALDVLAADDGGAS
jgi:hypothetical protein